MRITIWDTLIQAEAQIVPMRIQGDGHLREREGEQLHP